VTVDETDSEDADGSDDDPTTDATPGVDVDAELESIKSELDDRENGGRGTDGRSDGTADSSGDDADGGDDTSTPDSSGES